MTGVTPNEAETLIANLIFKNADVNRGTDLQLGLFTNSGTIDDTITYASITEPTGGGYARKTLTDGSWTVTDDTAAYALQTFTVSGTDYSAAVYGYFIATTGTAPKILAIEVDASGPYTMVVGDSYDVTPSITVA